MFTLKRTIIQWEPSGADAFPNLGRNKIITQLHMGVRIEVYAPFSLVILSATLMRALNYCTEQLCLGWNP